MSAGQAEQAGHGQSGQAGNGKAGKAGNHAELADTWLAERPRLLGLAYTVLGSWADAEDVLSEAWLRLDRASGTVRWPSQPAAWLTTVVSRLALDAATSAARRREEYIGPWLPETLIRDAASSATVEDQIVLGEQVDLAFIRLIHGLSPLDRVILVLSEVAGLPHREIAEITGSTAAATRQRMHRAKASLQNQEAEANEPCSRERTVKLVDPVTADQETLDALATALRAGDLGELIRQLSGDCVLWVDSGGLSTAARNPILGAARIHRFLAGLIMKYGMPKVDVVDAVGGPVLRAVSTDLTRIVTLEVIDNQVTGIQIQQNPHKIVERYSVVRKSPTTSA